MGATLVWRWLRVAATLGGNLLLLENNTMAVSRNYSTPTDQLHLRVPLHVCPAEGARRCPKAAICAQKRQTRRSSSPGECVLALFALMAPWCCRKTHTPVDSAMQFIVNVHLLRSGVECAAGACPLSRTLTDYVIRFRGIPGDSIMTFTCDDGPGPFCLLPSMIRSRRIAWKRNCGWHGCHSACVSRMRAAAG